MSTVTPLADRRTVRITGGTPLHGSVPVQGSKNIALHLYAGALLADESLVLTGVPEILDTAVCAEILTSTGTRTTMTGNRFVVTPPTDYWSPVIPDELGRRVRTTAVMARGPCSLRDGDVPGPGRGRFLCPLHRPAPGRDGRRRG